MKARKVTAIDELNFLIEAYQIPDLVKWDVTQRLCDWKSSSAYVSDDDLYLWQQVRYVKNFIKLSKVRLKDEV